MKKSTHSCLALNYNFTSRSFNQFVFQVIYQQFRVLLYSFVYLPLPVFH